LRRNEREVRRREDAKGGKRNEALKFMECLGSKCSFVSQILGWKKKNNKGWTRF
jgi:hypothetical protein